MKALIVVDLPDGIKLDEYNAFINVERMCIPLGSLGEEKIYSDYFKFKFVPLKPMPERPSIIEGRWFYEDGTYSEPFGNKEYARGWDDCINAILGET